MSELSRLRGSERYGACDDEISVYQAAEWETRSGLCSSIAAEARQTGVPNIMTMKTPGDFARSA